MTHDDDWPPVPEDIWEATGSEGAAVVGYPTDPTAEPVHGVMLRLAAVRGDEELDTTYLLDEAQAANLLAGLIGTAQQAFTRDGLGQAVARVLGLPQPPSPAGAMADELRAMGYRVDPPPKV